MVILAQPAGMMYAKSKGNPAFVKLVLVCLHPYYSFSLPKRQEVTPHLNVVVPQPRPRGGEKKAKFGVLQCETLQNPKFRVFRPLSRRDREAYPKGKGGRGDRARSHHG